MPQDRITGAAGNAFGRETAPLVAKAVGAIMLGSQSNEAIFNGNRIVIKCARQNTSSVGVTYLMLKRLDAVAGAFQQNDGTFEVLLLSSETFRLEMRPSQSKGTSAGKVGLVSKGVFASKGKHIGTFRLQAIAPNP